MFDSTTTKTSMLSDLRRKSSSVMALRPATSSAVAFADFMPLNGLAVTSSRPPHCLSLGLPFFAVRVVRAVVALPQVAALLGAVVGRAGVPAVALVAVRVGCCYSEQQTNC